MITKMFDRPVYLRESKDVLREIMTLEEAIDFLEGWPEKQRDARYEAALKACRLADDGHTPLQFARDALRAFGSKKGILAKSKTVQPWMIKPMRGGRLTA